VKKIKSALKKLSSPKVFIPLIIILVVIGAVGFFFFNQYQKNQNLEKSSSLTQSEIDELVKRVGALIELPIGESPTVATVSDKAKLAGQQFFANAENGDKVLVYAQGKKAFLFRPSQNKLIEVAFYNPPVAENTSPSVTVEPSGTTITPTPKLVRVVVYNGTKTVGLAKTAGENLSGKFQNIEVTSTANASGDFTKTIVIDVSGSNKALAQSLATELKGEVGSLPAGEEKPDSDILVIVGSK
jgi:hypothetical protein